MQRPSMTLRAGRVSLAFLATTALSMAFAFGADSAAGPPTVRVRFGDLNLASPRGIAALYRRLVYAAETVCSPYLQTASLIPPASFVACRKKAIADAIASIGRPELTQYFRRQQGDQPVQAAAVGAPGSPGG